MSHGKNKTFFYSGHRDLSGEVIKCIIIYSNIFNSHRKKCRIKYYIDDCYIICIQDKTILK